MMNEDKKRSIRSFILRQGRMTDAQETAVHDLWSQYGLDIQLTPYDFSAVFGREAPCTLEIGFGMGDSLLAEAIAHPEQNFIGIEVHRPGVGALFQGLKRHELNHVRVFNTDANDVLRDAISDSSLDRVCLFFPDPWPKRRHHKRRIVQPDFVRLVVSKLKPGGIFHLATDWQEYAVHMLEVLGQESALENTVGVGHYAEHIERPSTKFERRGRALGHGIWDLMFKKA